MYTIFSLPFQLHTNRVMFIKTHGGFVDITCKLIQFKIKLKYANSQVLYLII